ncbi:hypothetical protein ACP70R_021160 [Stipagrostis hirtigluma subsp. patula]
MASPHLKRKQPKGQGAVMGSASLQSYGPPRGVSALYLPEASLVDGQKRRHHLAKGHRPPHIYMDVVSTHLVSELLLRKDKLSQVKYTFTPFFDGHLWRKYGEKKIKASTFRRKYYRCSYYEDKKCLASMQVQQVNSDDPPLFAVTYTRKHTCNVAPFRVPDAVVAAAEAAAASDGLVLRFGSSDGDGDGGGGGGGHHHHDDVQMQQGRRPNHQPAVPPSLFFTMSPGASSSQLQQQPVLPSNPSAGASSSSSLFPIEEEVSPWFPAEEASPLAPSTNHDEDGFSMTWNSFRYELEDHLNFGDHVHYFPGKEHVFLWRMMDVHLFTWAQESKETT